MELKNCVSKAFKDSCEKYSKILNSGFKPWANNKKASIHETNMVMNFMESYKSQRKNDCVTWVEFAVPYRKDMQDKKKKINHIDGFIVDGTRVILIEAKRLSKVEERKKELETDLSVLVDVFKDKDLSKLKPVTVENMPGIIIFDTVVTVHNNSFVKFQRK